MAFVAVAALAAIGVHVAAGHAAAGSSWSRAANVAVQWAHFTGVGVWMGGLAALLLGAPGVPSAAAAAAVRRFSAVAAVCLIIVVATGIVRTGVELTSWSELISTRYGSVVLAKIALIAAIAAFGAINRWRSVPVAATTLRPLRRTSRAELVFATGALAAAAVLGTLPPPVTGLAAPLGITVSGTDFGTTVRVRLTTASDQPGPNRFVVDAVDYDSKAQVNARRVSLRFFPLDDPGVATTSLPLTRAADGSYVGSGANLAFDGRWHVTVLIERAEDALEVPLEVETRSLPQFVSIEQSPGQAPMYTVQVTGAGHVRISPDPERAGPSKVSVTCFDGIYEDRPIDAIVVTAAAGAGPMRQLPVRRMDRSRFTADVDLQPGPNRIAVVARGTDGTRMRAAVEFVVPR
jgi:hypothetical protein